MGRFSDIFSSVTEKAKDRLQSQIQQKKEELQEHIQQQKKELQERIQQKRDDIQAQLRQKQDEFLAQIQNGLKTQEAQQPEKPKVQQPEVAEVQQSAPKIDIESLFEPELSMDELRAKNLPDARKWAASMAIRSEMRARIKVEEAAKCAAEEKARAEAEEAARLAAEEKARAEAEEAARLAAEEKARAEAGGRPNGDTPAVEVKKQVRAAEVASWRTKHESEEAAAISGQLDKDFMDVCKAIRDGAATLDELESAMGRKVFIYCTEVEKYQILFKSAAAQQTKIAEPAKIVKPAEIAKPVATENTAQGVAEWKDGVITYKGEFVYKSYLDIWSSGDISNDAIVKVDFSQAEGMSECPDFSRCGNLKEILLPHGLRVIPNNAFAMCSSLEHIELPSTVESIGDNAFRECKSLKHIELPSSVVSIGAAAFSDAGMESITLPAGLKTLNYIGEVKYIDASQCRNVRSIAKDIFRGSSVVYLPAGVEELADNAVQFADTVYAPATLRRVGELFRVKSLVCLSPILNSLRISDGKISLFVKDEYSDSYVSRAQREGVLNTKVELFARAVNEYFYNE